MKKHYWILGAKLELRYLQNRVKKHKIVELRFSLSFISRRFCYFSTLEPWFARVCVTVHHKLSSYFVLPVFLIPSCLQTRFNYHEMRFCTTKTVSERVKRTHFIDCLCTSS